jgi:hypothetical protein
VSVVGPGSGRLRAGRAQTAAAGSDRGHTSTFENPRVLLLGVFPSSTASPSPSLCSLMRLALRRWPLCSTVLARGAQSSASVELRLQFRSAGQAPRPDRQEGHKSAALKSSTGWPRETERRGGGEVELARRVERARWSGRLVPAGAGGSGGDAGRLLPSAVVGGSDVGKGRPRLATPSRWLLPDPCCCCCC